MQFTLYTEKTVAQCISALNERIAAHPTATRPAIDGWVQKKGGRFSLGISTPVLLGIRRRTRLTGEITRESGVTVIRGDVSDGVGPRGQMLILSGMIAIAILSLFQQQVLLAGGLLIGAGALYVVMKGDYQNSDRLLLEIERVLKATPKPPKKLTAKK